MLRKPCLTCRRGDSHVLVVAAVEDDLADDVSVLRGGVAPEHRGGVGPLDGEGSPRAALGEAARPVVVAEYPESVGEMMTVIPNSVSDRYRKT